MSARPGKLNFRQQNYRSQRNFNHGNQHTPKPVNNTIPKNQKNNYTIQQPKKKLPALQAQTNNKHRQQKKALKEEEPEEEESLDDHVYAGPTFSNAPAPSALPIPAFNSRGSPINQPITLQQQSMDLMNLIAPQKVVTAYELEKTNMALSEIQRGLRSMLKIES